MSEFGEENSIPRKEKALVLIAILIGCLVGCVSLGWAATRVVTPNNIVLMEDIADLNASSIYSPNSGIGAYSFLISAFTNDTGTFYRAVNGTSNKVIDAWTSTDVATVTQSAIDLATSTKPIEIVFTSGTFSGMQNLNESSFVTLQGQEGNSTIFLRTADKTILNFDGEQQCYVKNIAFYDPVGSTYTSSAITIAQTWRSYFENLNFNNFNKDIFYISGTNSTSYSYWNHFDSIFAYTQENASSGSLFNLNNYAMDSYINNVQTCNIDTGITAYGGANNWYPSNCWFVGGSHSIHIIADSWFGGWTITNIYSDTFKSHPIWLNASTGSIGNLELKNLWFYPKTNNIPNTIPDNVDYIRLDVSGGQTIQYTHFDSLQGTEVTTQVTNSYIINKQGAGTLVNCSFTNNFIPYLNNTARYNGITISDIQNDKLYLTHSRIDRIMVYDGATGASFTDTSYPANSGRNAYAYWKPADYQDNTIIGVYLQATGVVTANTGYIKLLANQTDVVGSEVTITGTSAAGIDTVRSGNIYANMPTSPAGLAFNRYIATSGTFTVFKIELLIIYA